MDPEVLKKINVGELVSMTPDGGAAVGYINGALVVCIKSDAVSAHILNLLDQCSLGEVMDKLQAAVTKKHTKETIQ